MVSSLISCVKIKPNRLVYSKEAVYYAIMRSSLGVLGTGEKGHLFQGNKGQILRGTGEQRLYWGNRKQIFDFGGTRE